MSITFVPAKKEQAGIIPNDWIYPEDFVSLAGPSMANNVINRQQTDYERNSKNQPWRRYAGENSVDASAIQTDYQEQFLQYLGKPELPAALATIIASANLVFNAYNMGDIIIHRDSNPKVGTIASWTNAPLNHKRLSEFDPKFVAWAEAFRPDQLEEPYTFEDVAVALSYPDAAVIQYQDDSIAGGRAIPAHLVHVSLAKQRQKENAALLKEQADKLEAILKQALAEL